MDAKDLMIGDWVKNDLGETQQVVELREEGVMLSYNDIYPYDYIEPIPLTPEILEKNGFIEHKLQRMSIWQDDNFHLECHFTTWMYYWANGDVVINYVHELQRALNLCHIDKEIVL